MAYILKSRANPDNSIEMAYDNTMSQVRFTAMSMCKGKDRIEIGDGYTVYNSKNQIVGRYTNKRIGEVYISNSKYMWKSFKKGDSYELTKSGNIKRK